MLNLTLVCSDNKLQIDYNEYLELLANRVQRLAELEYERYIDYGDMQIDMNQYIPSPQKIFNLEHLLKEGSLGTTLVEASLDYDGLTLYINSVKFPITLEPNKDYDSLYNYFDTQFKDWLADAFPGHKN